MWYLYVLRCYDGSFYTGITNDVSRRLAEHQAGRGARYTRTHLPVELVAAWLYPDRSTATRVELQFKALSRTGKQAWIAGRWPFMGGPFAFGMMGEPTPYHFCPRCGGCLEFQQIEDSQVLTCTVCGRYHYQNAKPCAGVLIVRDGAVLLVHRRIQPYQGYWDIPGGFMMPEETPEHCAIREAYEETGLTVRLLACLGFYMDHYHFQDDDYSILNIYFVATSKGEPCAGDDADDFRWFSLDALPEAIAFEHEPHVLADLRVWLAEKQGDAR